ncbi:MAG: TRAP transporter small permease subunit [Flexistipes sinusarabici]|uniref:TRAP transporter small permease subunit n=1 Tax=Flexistipes sinusarabici TaxID=2352 RepID=A0A5D0MQ77_FLESI|nr:TRAP transporter small permease subunit [Flexistipes sinusarabici]TYB33813.1 MAG: TRAP transporter small permease subunit [Flexistipes sinusarabici]
MLIKIESFFNGISKVLGYLTAFATVLMALNVFVDTMMRYLFHWGSVGMQEMEWHLLSVLILLGIPYTLMEEGHVRVDVIYDRLSHKKRAVINIIGTIVFIVTFSLLIATGSINFVVESFVSGETSNDPGGLPYRWIVKSLIPFSFFLLAFMSIGYIVKYINVFRHGDSLEKTEKDDIQEIL